MMMLSGLYCFKKSAYIFAIMINEMIVTIY